MSENANEVCRMMNVRAYPMKIEFNDGRDVIYAHGLSKRELFAAMAMQGSLANGEAMMAVAKRFIGNEPAGQKRVAEFSVQFADALLAELAK